MTTIIMSRFACTLDSPQKDSWGIYYHYVMNMDVPSFPLFSSGRFECSYKC